MPDFTKIDHCKLRVHCRTCRDSSPAGKKWRESLAKVFELPEKDFELSEDFPETDFACPNGIPWNATGDDLPEPSQPPPPTLVDRVQAACTKCERKTTCAFGQKDDCSKRRIINDDSQTWAVAKEECQTGAIRQVLPAEQTEHAKHANKRSVVERNYPNGKDTP